MDLEPGIKLFGFFTNNQHHLRRNLPHPPPPPPPTVQDQEPQLPSTTLSLAVQPSIPPVAKIRPNSPQLQHLPLRYRDLIALRKFKSNSPNVAHARITPSLSIHRYSTDTDVNVRPKKILKRPRLVSKKPESPSTTLSLSIHHPSVPPALENAQGQPCIKLFGALIVNPKKIIKRPRLRVPDPEDLPSNYREFVSGGELNGNKIELVYTRTLHPSDIDDHYKRLSMPCKQVKKGFLTTGEEELIHQSMKKGKKTLREKIDVTVVDPSLNIRHMKLAKWNDDTDVDADKKKSWWYALTNDWTKLLKDNELGVGDAIQVWSFRMIPSGALGFIIHKINQPDAGNDNGGVVVSDGSGSSGSHKEE